MIRAYRTHLLVFGGLLAVAFGCYWYMLATRSVAVTIRLPAAQMGGDSPGSQEPPTRSSTYAKQIPDARGMDGPNRAKSGDTTSDERSLGAADALESDGTPVVENNAWMLEEHELPEFVPFPTSQSIEKKCASYGNDPAINCSDIWSALEKIEKEKKDDPWATQVESKILAIVNSVPGYRPRSVACRETTCAVEVESALGTFSSKHWNPLRFELLSGGRVFTYEWDSGRRLTVTLSTFERR